MNAESIPDGEGLMEHRYRRYLLYCLYLSPTPMKLPDIAHQLTVWDSDADGDEFLWERFHIYGALYYDHLSVLCETAPVKYSQHDDSVDWDSDAEEFKSVVERELLTEVTELFQAEQSTFDTDEESL